MGMHDSKEEYNFILFDSKQHQRKRGRNESRINKFSTTLIDRMCGANFKNKVRRQPIISQRESVCGVVYLYVYCNVFTPIGTGTCPHHPEKYMNAPAHTHHDIALCWYIMLHHGGQSFSVIDKCNAYHTAF